MFLDNNIEKYLFFVIIIGAVAFMGYFAFITIRKMTKSAPKLSLLYKLEDDDPKVFNQILIDMRDGKLDYIFEPFTLQSSDIEDSGEYGLCLILKIDTGNDLWEVSIYEDAFEVYNLTNSMNQTIEVVYDIEDVHKTKEEVYQLIISKLK